MKAVIYITALISAAWEVSGYFEEYQSKESSEDGYLPGPKGTNCSCGWTNKGRVVGGRETLVNEFPLMAGLVDIEEKTLFCGAAIVTQYHALSAVHCTDKYKHKKIYLAVGKHELRTNNEKDAALYPIKRTIEHELYNDITLANDIALIVLERKIDFTQRVGPVCLPTKEINLENEHVKVLGWGLTTDRGSQSAVLMKANLKVISTEQCFYAYPIDLGSPKAKNVVCTFRHGKDSCEGDSGGPIIWLDHETNRYTLVGLVSHGKMCASSDPAVNVNVAHFMPWIQAKIAATHPGQRTCAKKSK